MNKIKQLVISVSILFLFLSTTAVLAYTEEGEIVTGEIGSNLTWELDKYDGTLTISGNGDMANENNGFYEWYYFRSDIKKVVVNEGVTKIAAYAFSLSNSADMNVYDNLTEVILPEGLLEIDYFAFANCGFEKITLPNSLQTIGTGAFSNCGNLKKIEIPAEVNKIDDDTFKDCTSLTDVAISNGVRSIGNYTFDGCSRLINLTIPESITSIGYSAFKKCSQLKDINIPDGVTSIGSYAFYNCTGVASIKIPDSIEMIAVVKEGIGNNIKSIFLRQQQTML